MNRPLALLVSLVAFLAAACLCRAEENLLKGCDFAKGDFAGWSGLASTEGKQVAPSRLGETPSLKLARTAADAAVSIEQTVRLKPQTLYRLSLTGAGAAQASLRVKPQCTTDKAFGDLYKAWATGTAPLRQTDTPLTTAFVFDSGLKADQALIIVYLSDPKQLGDFHITALSLSEIGSSKPRADELIVLHLGDSITITSYLPFEQRIEAILAPQLKPPAGKTIRQINLGADGEYIKELLTSGRYQKIVKEHLERVDVAIIRYGANDRRNGSPEEFKRQLALLCDQLQKDYPGIRLILGTGPFLLGANDINTKQYGPYWQAARDFAKERQLPLADIYARYEQANSDQLTRSKSDMHPSPSGVEQAAEAILPVLQGALATNP